MTYVNCAAIEPAFFAVMEPVIINEVK